MKGSGKSRAWVWRHAVLDSPLPSTTKLVLLTVSCFMNDLGQGAYRSTKDLARFSSLSERALCSHLQNAVDLGWLAKARRGLNGQRWKRHEYVALLPIPPHSDASAHTPEALIQDHRGADARRSEPLNRLQRGNIFSKSNSPPSLEEKDEGGFRFSQFWDAWPKGERPRERAVAQQRFLALSRKDRESAVEFAAVFRRAAARRGEVALMLPYLGERQFLEFDGAPEVTHDGFFRITPGTPEWAAWKAALSSRVNSERWSQQEALGYLLCRTRWPDPLTSGGYDERA